MGKALSLCQDLCIRVRQGRCIHCKSSEHHKVKLGVIQVEDTT